MPKNMRGVLEEFETGALHSGSKKGPKVTSRKQAIAIGESEQQRLRNSPVSGKFGRSGGGLSMGSHKPRALHNPKGLAARRTAAHEKVYAD